MNANTPQEARAYLVQHSYILTKGNDNVQDGLYQITVSRATGDKSWEGTLEKPGMAVQNSWILKEKGKCCLENEKKHSSANYCPHCGTGIHKNESWVKDYMPGMNGSLSEGVELPLPQGFINRLDGLSRLNRVFTGPQEIYPGVGGILSMPQQASPLVYPPEPINQPYLNQRLLPAEHVMRTTPINRLTMPVAQMAAANRINRLPNLDYLVGSGINIGANSRMTPQASGLVPAALGQQAMNQALYQQATKINLN